MKKSTIQTLTPLVKTRYLSLYDACYTNPKGAEKHWMIASRKTEEALCAIYFEEKEPLPDAVVLVAYHVEYEKLVLIKQLRMPLNDFVYELPAGLIDVGETVETTVGRELKEETGLDLIVIKHVQDKLFLSPGMTDESVALVYCTCKGELSTDYLEADEYIEPFYVTQEQASKLIDSDVKLDMKTYLILQQFALGQLSYF